MLHWVPGSNPWRCTSTWMAFLFVYTSQVWLLISPAANVALGLGFESRGEVLLAKLAISAAWRPKYVHTETWMAFFLPFSDAKRVFVSLAAMCIRFQFTVDAHFLLVFNYKNNRFLLWKINKCREMEGVIIYICTRVCLLTYTCFCDKMYTLQEQIIWVICSFVWRAKTPN